jgi:hypothetical protein|eukprot:762590-Prymnesium_polylepis.2
MKSDAVVEHHRAGVKMEKSRALQKVWRSYKGKWWKLSDLVRTSLVFKSPYDIAKCLNAIADDADVELLKTNNDKCRLRDGYDWRKSGGYRDVQLSVRLKSAEAKKMGVDNHLTEAQLHLKGTQSEG